MKTLVSNSGKKITFKKENGYFDTDSYITDELNQMIEIGLEMNNGKPFGGIVFYTTVMEDKGYDENLFYYNNGLVGFQNMDTFPIKEAMEKLEFYKQLTDVNPQPYFKEYCDAFMITIDGKIIR